MAGACGGLRQASFILAPDILNLMIPCSGHCLGMWDARQYCGPYYGGAGSTPPIVCKQRNLQTLPDGDRSASGLGTPGLIGRHTNVPSTESGRLGDSLENFSLFLCIELLNSEASPLCIEFSISQPISVSKARLTIFVPSCRFMS